jgi:FAD/FMN-containing dehydrogenase
MHAPPHDDIPIEDLRSEVRGRMILSGDPGYDEDRAIFYGGIDRRPAAIVRVAGADDVARVVSAAAGSGAELAVRCGGHSMAGSCVSDGGLVLDLRDMNAVEIDAEAGAAWAQTGLSTGEYTTVLGSQGLATGFGDTPSVGIGGLTLGGGVGYLTRKYGLTIDDLLAAELVTADGRLRHVDAEIEPDLFWAIRGGGGNFGVATRFRFRTHHLETIIGGMLLLPATPRVIAGFVAEAEAAPDDLSSIAIVMKAPPMPFVPEEHHGTLVVMATLAYAGPAEEGERVLAPFRDLATPLADMIHTMPYPEIYPTEEMPFKPIAAGRTMFVDHVDAGVATTILEHIGASDAMLAAAQIRVLGGAMARVPDDATAFAHRRSKIMVNLGALFAVPQERDKHEAWVEGFMQALRQGDDGAYVNFLGDEGEARVRAAYPGPTWDRLREIKRRYDPTNLFRLNQNIPPASD